MVQPFSAFARLWWLVLPLFPAGVTAADLPPLSPPIHPSAGQFYYFALTDRFADGNPANNTGGLAANLGRNTHGYDPTSAKFYHGGDLAGLRQQLPYLQGLGVTALWISPPFRNRTVQGIAGQESAAYHGYWFVDLLNVDPHFGTNAELADFVQALQGQGIKVFLDIVANHTADVIATQVGQYNYRDKTSNPYRSSSGATFDDRLYAYAGWGEATFPELSAATSFPYVPLLYPTDANLKNPAWLNNPVYYHNRGNSNFSGENSLYGDFSGLDDLFTEQPAVVNGLIDAYAHWITTTGIDGFRIDTVKHVNPEFWQAFGPAIRQRAAAADRPAFFQFGEAWSGDTGFLSEFSTTHALDATLDFGFAYAAADFLIWGSRTASDLRGFFEADDLYRDHDTTPDEQPTFLSNHDIGRFGGSLRQKFGQFGLQPAEQVDLQELGHALLLLARGQPIVYYGDEQGFTGTGDPGAREDMLPSQTLAYQNLTLIGTSQTPREANFNTAHPVYTAISRLAALRQQHPGLRQGPQIVRPTASNDVLAFSRIDRSTLTEYLVFLNRNRYANVSVQVPTYQAAGATWTCLLDSRNLASPQHGTLTTDAQGRVGLTLPAFQYAVFQANQPLPARDSAPLPSFASPSAGATVTLGSREVDGYLVRDRAEIKVNLSADTFAEVAFGVTRSSRPGQTWWLGTDDTPPYRIFYSPPSDLAQGETFTILVTVDDRRGHTASASLANLKFTSTGTAFVRPPAPPPRFLTFPADLSATALLPASLSAAVEGTDAGDLSYQWFKNGAPLPEARSATLSWSVVSPAEAGTYRLMAGNSRGRVLSDPVTVTVTVPFYPWDLSGLDGEAFGFLETWFGVLWFGVTYYPWVAHLQHGWVYLLDATPAGFWYYDFGLGYAYTSQALYPYLYSVDRAAWLYFFPDSSESRYFFDFVRQEIFSLPPAW